MTAVEHVPEAVGVVGAVGIGGVVALAIGPVRKVVSRRRLSRLPKFVAAGVVAAGLTLATAAPALAHPPDPCSHPVPVTTAARTGA